MVRRLALTTAVLAACQDEPFDLRRRDAGVEPKLAMDAANEADGHVPPQDRVNCDERTGDEPSLKLTEVASGLSQPVYVTSEPGNAARLYVLGRAGTIRLIEGSELVDRPFLDISELVLTQYVERGLLGLAFHPEYATNGRFFIYYTALAHEIYGDGHLVLAEYRRSGQDPDRANPEPSQILFRLPQAWQSHKGGMLAFDRDGFFRMAIGNGGFHDASGQTDTLHGKILRLDLDADEQPYGIPPGNVQGVGVRPEIWASGLRNPWRFSIDACTGDMYIGDVGGDYEEEIDVEPYGSGPSEYGFPYFEGTMCGDPPCTHEGDIKPVVSYRREARNCAVMGGFVYRGHAMPGLLGTYLYADHCSGRFWAFEYDGTASNHREITSIINPDPGLRQISSFGQDALGELYVTGFSSGAVYRIDPQ